MEPLQRVNRAGTHLLGLINQVLDLSKIEAGKLELNPQTVQLAPLINEVIGTAGQLAEQNKNRLVVDAQENLPIDEQGRWLATVIKGYFAYFAVPTNTYLLSAFRYHISMKWFQSLRRRSQRHRLTWKRMTQLIDRFLPSPCVLHPWPDQRFGVTYSR